MLFRTLLLSCFCATSFAAPAFLLTHNHTNMESNAYIDGTKPSLYPTRANSDSKVYWNAVKLACHHPGQVTTQCTALIKMGTDVPERAVDVGYVTLDLATGAITPSTVSGNGFTITINGPGETTITQP